MPGFGTMLQLARGRALLLHGPIGRFGRLFAPPRAGRVGTCTSDQHQQRRPSWGELGRVGGERWPGPEPAEGEGGGAVISSVVEPRPA